MRGRFAQQMFYWWVRDQKHFGHTTGFAVSAIELHYVYGPLEMLCHVAMADIVPAQTKSPIPDLYMPM